MALPTVQRAWTIVPNIRIKTNDGVVLPGVTGSMQKYLYTFKQVLTLSGGYTIKGSSANGTGAMDGVDRWSTPQAILAGTAGGNTNAYNSGVLGDLAWVCLNDTSGTDVVVAWQATVTQPDCAHIAYSPGGLFVTSSYHVSGGVFPTASDECHFQPMNNGGQNFSCVGANIAASRAADRILNFWISSDRRSFRVAPALISGSFSGAPSGRWGLEQVQAISLSGSVQWSGSWGFADRANNSQAQVFNGTYNITNTQPVGGQASMTLGGVFRQVQFVRGGEGFNTLVDNWNDVLTAAQGGTSYYLWPVPFACISSPTQGKFGNLVDWWRSDRVTVSAMDTYGTNNFVHVGASDGVVWPWDGATTPITS